MDIDEQIKQVKLKLKVLCFLLVNMFVFGFCAIVELFHYEFINATFWIVPFFITGECIRYLAISK